MFLWQAPHVRSVGEEAWAARADVAFAREVAASLEDASEHPIAQAVAAYAREQVGPLPAVEGFSNHGGQGVSGVVDGHAVVVGRASWLRDEWAMRAPEQLEANAADAEAEGRTPVWVGWDGRVRAVVVVSDTIKESSAEAIGQLRRRQLRGRGIAAALNGRDVPTARGGRWRVSSVRNVSSRIR